MNTSNFLDISILNESKNTLIDQYIKKVLKEGRKKELLTIFTPNPEQVVQAQQDPQFLAALQSAEILVPDGYGLVWASRFLHLYGKAEPIQERIAGVDLMLDLIHQFPSAPSMVIGGQHEGAVTEPKLLQVGQQTVHWLPGYHQVSSPTEAEESTLRKYIQKTKPKIVFVAFGAPYQEDWVVKHRAFLKEQGVRLVMVIGGAIDILTGKYRRAPGLIRSVGLEWLYRLIQQPRRWKRQLRLLSFIKLVADQVY